MGKIYPELNARLCDFIEQQQVFFVATAPLAADGHVNVSPKGLADTFTILDPTTVAYLDFTGSTAETIAHSKENGRITLMFCAFTGPPMILRIYGTAEVITVDHAEFVSLCEHFGDTTGARAIIRVQAERIGDSCGYGVPRYEFLEQREQLPKWVERKGPEAIVAYQQENNTKSIDGLPALPKPTK